MTAWDVAVVGCGNAALCAAISAREQGARVVVLEKAPEDERGGNSFFTAGGFRFVHDGLEDVCTDVLTDLSEAEKARIELPTHDRQYFYDTLMKVTRHQAEEDLAWTLIDESRPAMAWLRGNGVRFVPMFGRQSYEVDGKQVFYGGVNIEAVGGGAGLVDFLLRRAAAVGVEIRYETGAAGLVQDETGRVTGLRLRTPKGYEVLETGAVVLACGGFEANPEMRARYLGHGWDLARVRGTRHNTGDGIRMALEAGARPHGNWSGCHSVGWDISAPAYGDRAVGDNFQKHSYPLGIMVNLDGERFVDEGEDYRNLTYVRFGRAIMEQPHRWCAQIFDAKTVHMLRDEYRIREITKVEADSIEELAAGLEIDPQALAKTVREFNAACRSSNAYNPAVLDGVSTEGLSPDKTNWALPLDSPPYVAFVTTTGVTFTFGGLQIDDRNRVQDLSGRPMDGLYAAGELVGGLFFENYPGGSGLMSGSVFGRRAGRFAAEYACG